MKSNPFDDVVDSVINADRKGYEWRALKDGSGLVHHFYNSEENCYDNNLERMVKESAEGLGEFMRYSLSHPVKSIRFVRSVCRIRKRYLDRLR